MLNDRRTVDPSRVTDLLDALDNMTEPLLAIDSERFAYYANHAACKVLQIEAGTLPRKLTSVLPEGDLARSVERALQSAPTAAGTSTFSEFPWNSETKTYLVRVQQAGNSHLLWCTGLTPHSPLHKQLETEQHMRRFWASALAGVGSWTWDLNDNRLRSDSILAELTGLGDENTIYAEDLLEQVHPDDLPELQRALRRALDNAHDEDVDIDVEFRFIRSDGEALWLAMRGGVIRDNKGRPVILSGVHFDVTERKRAENSILKANEALEEANRAKDSFLAKVSHEIRTPLTTILGYAELMFKRVTQAQDKKDLTEILDSGHYLQSLVDDLLDLSRIIAGKVSIEPQAVDLRQLGNELLSTMNMRAGEKNLGFSLNVSSEIPTVTLSDPVRIRQILTNLTGNAIKFTEHGEVTVTIKTRESDDNQFIAFEVRDSGPGIESEKLEELFQPFTQARSSDSVRHGGLGLGLAISQRLAEILGGRIEASSQAGAGSTFTFLLPHIEVTVDPQDSAVELTAAADELSYDNLLRRRILVVDDVQSILSLLENYLITAGAEVTTATNGAEALDKLELAASRGEEFDVVLVDLHMPQLSGPATLERLRSTGHNMPVIAMSASTMKGDIEHSQRLGFADFVSKPFTADQVLNSVSNILSIRANPKPITTFKKSETAKLLLVEDHEALAELTAQQLATLGYTVEIAHTGTAALDRAKALIPSAMVIDLSLPDMDGIELCQTLHQDPALVNCRLIAYTGMEEPERHALARDAGFCAVLVKPADTSDFAALLKTDTIRE